jgi:hypothetical protein
LKRANLRRECSTIPEAAPRSNKAAAFPNQPSRFTVRRLFVSLAHGSLKSPRVLVRFDHVARFIINVNHGAM